MGYYERTGEAWKLINVGQVFHGGTTYPLAAVPADFWNADRKPAAAVPAYDPTTHKLEGPKELTDGTVGYTVEPLTVEERRALLPDRVTMRQARVYLHKVGMLDTVETAVAAQGPEAMLVWNYSQEVQRSNPLVAALGFTEEQLDVMFEEASKL